MNYIVYSDHPDNCIICNSPSFGEPQCKQCLTASQNYADKLNLKKKYSKNRDKLMQLWGKTLGKAGNEWNLEKRFTLCNQLVGIGIFNNIHFPQSQDMIDETYRVIDSMLKIFNN